MIKGTIRSKQNCINKTITLDPWVDLNDITTDGRDFYYKSKKLHPAAEHLGKGTYGGVIAYQHNGKNLIAVKTFTDQNDAEVEVRTINRLRKFNCNLIQAIVLQITDTRSHAHLPKVDKMPQTVVVMPAFDGTMDDFQYALQVEDIVNMGIQLGQEMQCLIKKYGLYYTDLKSAQVLYKCATNNTFHIRLADIGSIVPKNAWAGQTFPFPILGYNKEDFEETHKRADESVVVYGLVLYLLNFMGRNIYRESLYKLTHSTLLVDIENGEHVQNTYKEFLKNLEKIVQTSPLKIPSILKKLIGLQEEVTQKCDNPHCNNNIGKICNFTNGIYDGISMVCKTRFEQFCMENLCQYKDIKAAAPSTENSIYETIQQGQYTLENLLDGLELYKRGYRIDTN